MTIFSLGVHLASALSYLFDRSQLQRGRNLLPPIVRQHAHTVKMLCSFAFAVAQALLFARSRNDVMLVFLQWTIGFLDVGNCVYDAYMQKLLFVGFAVYFTGCMIALPARKYYAAHLALGLSLRVAVRLLAQRAQGQNASLDLSADEIANHRFLACDFNIFRWIDQPSSQVISTAMIFHMLDALLNIGYLVANKYQNRIN